MLFKTAYVPEGSSRMGYIVYFSRIINDPKDTNFKVHATIAYVNIGDAQYTFFRDYKNKDNCLYFRFKNFGLKEGFDIINIHTDKIEENERSRYLNIYLKDKEDNTVKPNYYYSLKFYNLNANEFFNQETIISLLDDKSRKYLFFFSDLTWQTIVDEFYLSGIILVGGSSNQRHIYNDHYFNMTFLLSGLFGLKFTHNLCDFMVYKDDPYLENKNMYNSGFNSSSKRNTVCRLFNKIADKGKNTQKISKFLKISNIIFGDAIKLGKSILPTELLRVWLGIVHAVDKDRELIYDLLTTILAKIDEEEDEKFILESLKKNFSFLKYNLESPSNSPQNTVIEDFRSSSVKEKPKPFRSRHVKEEELAKAKIVWYDRAFFMSSRFDPDSKYRYEYFPKNLEISNPFVTPKK